MKNRTKGKRLTGGKKAGQRQASFKKQALPAQSGLSQGPLRVVARRAISRNRGKTPARPLTRLSLRFEKGV